MLALKTQVHVDYSDFSLCDPLHSSPPPKKKKHNNNTELADTDVYLCFFSSSSVNGTL